MFYLGAAIHERSIEWLYFRNGLAEYTTQSIPWYIAKCKWYVFAYLKASATAMRKVIVWHDTLFALARQYPMPADHFIDHIYHHYLPTQDETPSQAEIGIDGDRSLQQLMGIVSTLFKST